MAFCLAEHENAYSKSCEIRGDRGGTLSLLARLESKGFVSVRKEKQMNYYTPRISKDNYQSQESKTILEKLYGNSLKNFVSSLYHGRAVEAEDIRELEDYLRDLETEKNDRHK